MSDFYNQHGQRPSNAGQYYAPPQEYGGGHHPSYGSSDAYSAASYQPQPQGYNAYAPPRPDSAGRYRGSPVPQNMQVAQAYRDDYYDDQRRRSSGGGHHHHHHHDDSYGSERGYDAVKSGDKGYDVKPPHSKEKDIGAMIAGGVVGAFAGHELGHGGMSTLIGAAAGAYGGHKIENHREKKKFEKQRRESEAASYDDYSRRSVSRERRGSRGSGGRRRSISSDSGSSVDSRRRSHHHNY